jgi:hypothetical protein
MEVRNRLDEAQANAVRVEGGWKSRQTVAGEENLEWQDEVRNMKEYDQQFPAPQSAKDKEGGKRSADSGMRPGPEVPKPPHPLTEAEGPEHKPAGPGGGQFVAKGGGGAGGGSSSTRTGKPPNALDAPIEHRAGLLHKEDWKETTRDFIGRMHKTVRERPEKPVFHDPERLKVEKELTALAGNHAESLFAAHGVTWIAGENGLVTVSPEGEGAVSLRGVATHGPDPRNPAHVTITAAMPAEERSYRLRSALGLPTSKEERRTYKAQDRAARQARKSRRGSSSGD